MSEAYTSRMLIDRDNTDSDRLQVNQGVLKAGCRLEGASHPQPYDELYVVLSGNAVLHMGQEDYTLRPGSVVFIPWGTFHALENLSAAEDVVILTIWPQTPEPGGNGVYDKRLEQWGTSFRRVSDQDE
jgi:quercetin dioxygenase-like cupin family protein